MTSDNTTPPRAEGDDDVQRRTVEALGNALILSAGEEVAVSGNDEPYHGLYDMLRSMCDNIPDLIWAKDLQKRYLYANPAMCSKLLIADHPAEVVGKTDLFFAQRQRALHPERADWHTFGEICSDTDDTVIASRAPGRFDEYGNIRGEPLFLDVYKAPFLNAAGELIGTVGCGRDVTREKQTEEAHRQSLQALHELAEQYRSIIAASYDGFFLLDDHGTILDVNDAYCRMSGYSRDEILQMKIRDFEGVESAGGIEQHLLAIIQQGSDRFETLHRTKNGDFLEIEVSAIFSAVTGRLVAFIRNITPRRRIQRALAESENRYKKLLYSVTDYIYSVTIENGRSVKTEHGPGCAAITGYEQEDFLRDPDLWISMVHEDDRSKVAAQIEAILSGADAAPVEHRIIRKNGSVRWVSNVPVLWRDNEGHLVSYDGLISDITDRKQAELALRVSEERARHIIDMTPEGIVIHRDARILYVNPEAARHAGKAPEQLVGQSLQEFVPPEYQSVMMNRLASLKKYGDVTPLSHYRMIMCDGSSLDGEITSTLIDFDGSPAVLSMMRDISERIRAENSVRESERKLSALLENSPDVVVRYNLDLRCIYMSPAIVHYTGRLPEWFIDRRCSDAGLSVGLCSLLEDSLRRVVRTGVPDEFEYDVVALGARKIVFNCRHIPEFDGQGQVQSVLSISRDITEHRRLERDYRMLFQSMVEGFALHEIILDNGVPVDYRFLAVNPSFERLTGMHAVDIVGRTVRDVLPGTEPHWIGRYGRVALTGESDSFEAFSEALGKWFDVNVYRPASGQFACTFVDVTHRKQAELEQKRLEEQLRQSQKMEAIGILAGGVAHDFNNIIQAIVGNAYLLKRRNQEDAESQMFVDEVIQLSNRAADLTRGLLAFSRKQLLSPQLLDLNEVVRGAIRMFSRIIGEDIEVSAVFADRALMVEIDPGQIQQVVLNLATNARDAMVQGGRLTIETTVQTRSVSDGAGTEQLFACVSMTDTGNGIPEDDLTHIFEPFYTTKEVGKGTGLGLSVVYGIVKQHGGHVEVLSEIGKGTVVHILLPISSQHVEVLPPSPASVVEGGAETLLLVEDDDGVRRATRRLLESAGYTVLEASEGMTGLELFRLHLREIRLVLLDVVMPGMSGRDVYDQLVLVDPGVRVIFMSGYPEDVLTRMNLGLIEYVNKPIMPEELLAKVRCVIEGTPGRKAARG